MKPSLLFSASPFRRIVALAILAAVAPACGKTHPHPFVPPNPGTIGFLQAVFTAAENGGTATITVRRGGGSLGAVSVDYATSSGTATSGTDFTAANGTLSWADGDAADKTFTVTITNDGAVEGDETVGLTLSLPTGGSALGLSSAILNITDDDAPAAGVVQFDSATYSVSEAATTAVITVTRTGGNAGAASVNWSITGGTATGGGTDYAATPGTLNWAAGDAAPKTFTITIANDALPEATETINLLLSGAVGASLGTTSTAVLSILDNDSNGTLAFSSATYSVTESGAVATITVTRTGGIGGAVGVTYATSNGTATAGSDYTAATSTLSWGDGDGSSKTFSVFIADDTTVEGNETVNLTLSSPTGGATLGLAAAVLTILDDDCTIQFTNATYNLTEAGGTQTITVSRVGSTLGSASVDFADAGGGSATGAGTDYTVTAGTLTWAIGDAANKTISIPVVGDSLAEDNETLNLVLTNAAGVGARLGTQTTAIATIVDDDVQFVFSSPTYSVAEAGGNVVLTVNRVGASNGAASVQWTVTGGTAANPADFTGPVTGTLNWASGVTTAQTITIPIVSDSLAEANETIIVDLSAPTLIGGNATLGAVSQATVTITDDDTNLAFSQATYSVAENVAGGTLTVTVNRTGVTTGTSTVNWGFNGGSAVLATDYNGTPGTLTFGPGVTSQTFNLTILDDLLVQGNLTINLQLTTPTGGTLGAQNTSVVTILEDDAPGTLAYTNATFTVAESVGNALITVSRTGGVGNAVAVTWNITGGSATSGGVDFSGPLTGTLNWAAGDSANKTITIPIVDDFLVEGTENIALNLTGATGGATIGAQSTTAVNITDNDVPGSIQFTNATYNFTENSGIVNVTVSRTGGVGNAVSVDWSITGGTATGGANDYAATPATLNWAAGDGANQNIQITLTPDNVVEPNETILLLISNVQGGATLGAQQTATVTIVDDDTNLQFTAPTVNVNENASPLIVTVSRTGITTGASSVTWSVTGGTAANPTDFTGPTSGLLSWAAGDASNKTISIPIVDNVLLDGNRTINLGLSGQSGATLGSQATMIATIVDDDSPGTLQFTSAAYNVNEGGTATITVSRTGGVGGTVGLTFATSDGSANAGSDYTSNSNTLSWGPGDSANKTFTVATTPDANVEGTETVNLTLSAPSGGATLGLSSAVLSIVDSAGAITLSSSTYSVNENAGPAVITLNRVGGNGGAVSVQLSTSNGTATAGSDYTAVSNQLVSWADGDTAPKTVNITINNDTVGEGDETVNISLNTLTGGAVFGANSTAVLTIVDDDTSLVFSSATYSAGEGAGSVIITVNRVGVLTNAVSADWIITGGSAIGGGTDYSATPGTLSWGAGVGGSQTFTINIVDDGTMEPNETINLGLTNLTGGATLGTPGTAVLTIVDNDGPNITVTQSTVLVEGTGPGTTTYPFIVSLSQAPVSTVTVNYTTTDGTATVADGDYTPINGTLTWLAGDSSIRTLVVTIGRDNKHELNETFTVDLSGAVGGTITVPSATGTINDDDPIPTISIADLSQVEGNSGQSAFNFVVTLNHPTFQTVTVNYSTADGTATLANNDYVQVINGTVTFPPGSTSQSATVMVNGDAALEANETFNVNLTSPVNATIADGLAVGTILNDEGPSVTNSNPTNNQTGVLLDSTLVLTFSEAMQKPATEGAITISRNPIASPLPTFIPVWSAGDTVLTLVFDTTAPAATTLAQIRPDDLLKENTTYTVAVGTGAVGATSGLNLSAPYSTQFTTVPDATPPQISSFSPNILTTLITAGADPTDILVNYNEAMNTGNTFVSLEGPFKLQAGIGSDGTGSGRTLHLNWNTTQQLLIRVTGGGGLPAKTGFRLDISSVADAAGNYVNGNNEYTLVTSNPGADAVAPICPGCIPENGASNVDRDSSIFVVFTEPMFPDILSHVTVSGTATAGIPFDMRYECSDFTNVSITPRKAWGVGTVTVTIDCSAGGARDTKGNLLVPNSGSNRVMSFTTTAGTGAAPVIDDPASTFKSAVNFVDVDTNNFQGTVSLKYAATGATAFINRVALGAADYSLNETTSGMPVKGINVGVGNSRGSGLSVDRFTNRVSSLSNNTNYTLTLKNTVLSSRDVAFAGQAYTFTTIAGGGNPNVSFNSYPRVQLQTQKGSTTVQLDLQLDVQNNNAPGGETTSVNAAKLTGGDSFTNTGTSPGGTQFYNYSFKGGSTGVVTFGDFPVTFTVSDSSGIPGHSVAVVSKGYHFNDATELTASLTGPALTGAGTTPTYTWSWPGAVPAAVQGYFIQITDNGGNTVYQIPLNPSATSFTQPSDYPLTNPGTYTFNLAVIHFTDNIVQQNNDVQIGLIGSRTFTTQ